ncbi:MAG TPA: hypothetical protein DCQ64_29465 [Candidatus Rokubacteria bacterium]|nr:MAG: hypothetical protein A2X53_00800 [Candidatus Rokubacteria bacterium GWA2_70_23]OGK90366.1 MAG: hypothetical protein A2X50_06980 [Candidatus Rokubacteria bacterium GWF2_70_14]HAM59315.1 hypothetical protein [Candidatus Rokubacteria bacterium]
MGHFIGLCFVLLVAGAGTTLFAPLLPLYQEAFGLGTGAAGLAASVYGITIIPAMLLAGPLTDRLGRGALLFPGVACFALGDLAFALAAGLPWLIAGRLLHGLAMGAVFSPLVALASDLMERERPGLAALGAAVASMTGFGVGPLVTGLALHAGIAPARAPFLIHAGLMLIGAAFLVAPLRARHTAAALTSPPGSTGGQDDRGARRLALLGGVGGWAVGGALLVMLPILLLPLGGRDHPFLGGAALAAVNGAGVAAQLATWRWAPMRALALGALGEALGLGLLVAGLAAGSQPLALGAAALIGLGLAAVHRGGLGVTIRATTAHRKGQALSLFLVGAYAAANFSTAAFGLLADAVGTVSALAAYAAVFGALLVATALRALVGLPAKIPRTALVAAITTPRP